MEDEKVTVDRPEKKKEKKAKDKKANGEEKTKDAGALKLKLEKLEAKMMALAVKKEAIQKLLLAAEGSAAGSGQEQAAPPA
ncbi:unnamed protein product [Spirodela intermedia]|uniref:Uncharacterized protein n=2 Tax=Spirodela intermedia TaxID=51605 RepID=A0A7I8JTH7_SPIIN|nr:unnamed protein product [Spirodela intermedia]CAA6672752.1 unnamed protein product [Spirodela intermedia]CAA7409983.1 unnamed protein product [Spirodela intermedia]